MTIISKAVLAAELKVSKSRVSQYLRAGLPERSDGKIDRESALNWIALNLRSGVNHDKGPARARELEPPPAGVIGDAAAARRALSGFAGQVLFYVAGTAVDLGLPMRTVYALVTELAAGLDDAAGDQMLRFGGSCRDRMVSSAKAMSVNWVDLAGRADEPADLAAWEAHHAEVHARLYPEVVFDEVGPDPDHL